MRILLDARVVEDDGIGRFTKNYIHFVKEKLKKEELFYISRTKMEGINPCYYDNSSHYTLKEIENLNNAVEIIKPDLLHCFDYRVPLEKCSTPIVVNIHDVFRLLDPSQCYTDEEFIKKYGQVIFEEMKRTTVKIKENISYFYNHNTYDYGCNHFQYYSNLLMWALLTADYIICPTLTVKNDIIKQFNFINLEKIKVLHYGLNHQVDTLNSQKTLQLSINMDFNIKDVFLYVGQYRKHKKVDKILLAISKIKKIHPEVQLLLIGKDFQDNEIIKEIIKELDICENVVQLGFIEDCFLKKLYKNAIALVQLSDYEGYGFSPMEAILHGGRVILSDIKVFHELFGEKAIYVNNNDVNEIVSGMILAFNMTSDTKSDIIDVNKHTWQYYVDSMLLIYQEILSKI